MLSLLIQSHLQKRAQSTRVVNIDLKFSSNNAGGGYGRREGGNDRRSGQRTGNQRTTGGPSGSGRQTGQRRLNAQDFPSL